MATSPLSSSWCICAFCSNISSSRSGGRGKGQFSRPTPGLPLPTAPLPGPYLPRPTPQRPAQDRAGGRCPEDAQRMCEAEWGTRRVSPESHLPSIHPAAGLAVGPPTRRAAGPSPRAGGRGETQLCEARKGSEPSSPHPPPPCTPRVASFSPTPRPPPWPHGLPVPGVSWAAGVAFCTHPTPPGSAPQSANPPGLPGKSRLSPHRRGGTLRWGLTPAPSSAGGHGGTCGPGLPGRRGRRQSLFPRMRRSLPGAGAPGLLCSPHLGGGVAGRGVLEDSLPQEAAPSADVHLQHPCAAGISGPRRTFHLCALPGPSHRGSCL